MDTFCGCGPGDLYPSFARLHSYEPRHTFYMNVFKKLIKQKLASCIILSQDHMGRNLHGVFSIRPLPSIQPILNYRSHIQRRLSRYYNVNLTVLN
jgi:hypothetical protein